MVSYASYSTWSAVAGVAGPAIVMNSAAPICNAAQTALLGQYAGTVALAAYAACIISSGECSTHHAILPVGQGPSHFPPLITPDTLCVHTHTGFAVRIFNFLVDGVSAKVGKSVGRLAWGEVSARVKIALVWALSAGAVAALTLAAVRRTVMVDVLALSSEVKAEAVPYWWLRVAAVPLLLLNMAMSGILQVGAVVQAKREREEVWIINANEYCMRSAPHLSPACAHTLGCMRACHVCARTLPSTHASHTFAYKFPCTHGMPCVQGFRHVRISALINSAQSLAELGGSVAMLRFGITVLGAKGLFGMGLVTIITQVLAALAGLACILFISPAEGQGHFLLWTDWFGRADDGGGDAAADLRVALLKPTGHRAPDSIESPQGVVQSSETPDGEPGEGGGEGDGNHAAANGVQEDAWVEEETTMQEHFLDFLR
jgi:hypothetical protein